MPQKVLIVGATRGLGASLANLYTSQSDTVVYGTTRSSEEPKSSEKQKLEEGIKWLTGVDVSEKDVGGKIVAGLKAKKESSLDVVVSYCLLHFISAMEYKKTLGYYEIRLKLNQIITAGYFGTEDFKEGPKWDEEVKM